VAVVGQGAEGELDGLVFGLEGHADDVLGGGLGEVDFGKRFLFVFRHVRFHSSRVGDAM